MLAGFTHAPVVELSERLARARARPASATRSSPPTAPRPPRSRSRWRSTTGPTAAGAARTASWRSPAAITARRWARSRVTDVPIFRDAYAPLLRDNARVAPFPGATRGCAGDALERLLAERDARDRRADRRAAGAGRQRACACTTPEYLRARARALHALRRAADRRRDHDRLRPHRERCSRASRPASRRTSCACRRASPAATCRCRACCRPTTVYGAFYDDDVARGFLHSHSYTGNALACRAALAVLDIFERDDVIAANRERRPRASRSRRRAARRAPERAQLPPPRDDLGLRGRERRTGVRARAPSSRARSAACCCGRSATPSTSCRRTSSTDEEFALLVDAGLAIADRFGTLA